MSAAGKNAPSESEKDAEQSATEAQSPKRSKKKLILGAACGVLLLGGGLGVSLFAFEEGASAVVIEEDLPPIIKMAKIDTFIANLSENSAFVKVGIVIEYDLRIINRLMDGLAEGGGHAYGGGAAGKKKEDPLALPPLMAEREPVIRHAIIKTLSSRRSEDILSTEGKEELREALIVAINEAISEDESPVTQVYFTEFVIQ